MEPVISEPSPQITSEYQVPPPTKFNFWLVSTLVLFIALVGILGYFLGVSKNQNSQKSSDNISQSNTSNASPFSKQIESSSPTIQADPTANWKTYTIKTVGMEFKLPPQLAKLGELKEEFIPTPGTPGQKGTELCLKFSNTVSWFEKEAYAGGFGCDSSASFVIGGSSVDWEAPREGMFTDLQGFKFENGKYYEKMNLNRFYEIPSQYAHEVNNLNGVSIVKTIGGNEFSIPGTPGEGWFGALINTKNKTYPGLSLRIRDTVVDENTFDQILSTFKFTK